MEVISNLHILILYCCCNVLKNNIMEKDTSRHTMSIKMDIDLYWKLKDEVGKGRISRFIENLVAKELNKQEQKLAQEYQEAAQDKSRWKEASEWEAAQMTDWNKQDDGEDN